MKAHKTTNLGTGSALLVEHQQKGRMTGVMSRKFLASAVAGAALGGVSLPGHALAVPGIDGVARMPDRRDRSRGRHVRGGRQPDQPSRRWWGPDPRTRGRRRDRHRQPAVRGAARGGGGGGSPNPSGSRSADPTVGHPTGITTRWTPHRPPSRSARATRSPLRRAGRSPLRGTAPAGRGTDDADGSGLRITAGLPGVPVTGADSGEPAWSRTARPGRCRHGAKPPLPA